MIPDQIHSGTPAYRRVNLALFIGGFATFSLMHCVQPLLPEFARQFNLSAATSSLAVSLTTVCLAVSMPPLGLLGDAWGRKPTMVASTLAAAVLTVTLAFTDRWAWFLGLRAVEGVTLAGLPVLTMAYLGEEMHPRVLGRAMGLYIAGSALGGMSGRVVAAALTDFLSWRVAIGTVGGLGIVAGLAIWAILPESAHFHPRVVELRAIAPSYRAHLRESVLLRLFVEAFLLLGSFVTLYNYVTFRLIAPPFSLSQASAGLVFLLLLAGMLGSAWSGSQLSRLHATGSRVTRFALHGRGRMLRLGVLLMIVGLLVSGIPWLPAVFGGAGLLTFGFFAAQTVSSGWVAAQAHVGKAQASALYLLFYYVGASVAGTLGGIFWTAFRWPGVTAFPSRSQSKVAIFASSRCEGWRRRPSGRRRQMNTLVRLGMSLAPKGLLLLFPLEGTT